MGRPAGDRPETAQRIMIGRKSGQRACRKTLCPPGDDDTNHRRLPGGVFNSPTVANISMHLIWWAGTMMP